MVRAGDSYVMDTSKHESVSSQVALKSAHYYSITAVLGKDKRCIRMTWFLGFDARTARETHVGQSPGWASAEILVSSVSFFILDRRASMRILQDGN